MDSFNKTTSSLTNKVINNIGVAKSIMAVKIIITILAIICMMTITGVIYTLLFLATGLFSIEILDMLIKKAYPNGISVNDKNII